MYHHILFTIILLIKKSPVLAQPVHSNIVPSGAQQSQLPLHPPQQPTPQPPIPGQHVGQGSVIPMAYFVQQQAFSAPPHAQQAIGNIDLYYNLQRVLNLKI